MLAESLFFDIRYAVRGLRRSPLYAAIVAATIGLGLGVLCSAFTILNAYVLRPIDLPDPHALVALSWDTDTVRRHRFGLADYEAIRDSAPHFSDLAAGEEATVVQDGVRMRGLLVTSNYFQLLGGRTAIGRTLRPDDAAALGGGAVVVLSHHAWRSRYGSDPFIIGKQVALGRQRLEVVGVTPPNFGLPGEETVSFWAPLTMARAFGLADPRADVNVPALFVIGRLQQGATESQVRGWLEVWLRQRFPTGSESAPVAVRVESRATRIPRTAMTLTMLSLILSAFALVLCVACANVTNLMLARALARQREIGVRMSLGASRWRVGRQIIVESLVLAVPASMVGLALTMITARVFPALIISTFPVGVAPVEALLVPLDPDGYVLTFLVAVAVLSAVLVSLAPAVRMTRANLVRASRGEAGSDTRRSRLRTGLVAAQIGACVLFVVGATGLINESRRLANPDPGLAYERVAVVQVAAPLRAAVAERLASDPSVERVAAAWRAPLDGPLPPIGIVASETRIERVAGFMVVSPEYFPLFDVRITRGRAFTTREAQDGAPVALVSEATARALWPRLDPIGQTLDLVQSAALPSGRRPSHRSVSIIGVTEDVVSGTLIDGLDTTCVYFATGPSAGEVTLLVRGRADMAALRTSVTAAVNAMEPNAPFEFYLMRELLGGLAWVFQAFAVAASLLGVIGLIMAFSGTYGVVAFLVSQRTREFGVRIALGATVTRIIWAMIAETFRTASVGLAVGLATAVALVRASGSVNEMMPTFGLRPYAVATTIVLVSTITAALLPSLRIARIDPSRALRAE